MVDVIVVGAGVAGLTAARDLGRSGCRVHVLEARERLGGRAYYDQPHGISEIVELGGGWFGLDLQPPLAAEVERYGLAVDDAVAYDDLRWHTGGELRHGFPVGRYAGGDLERLVVELHIAGRELAEGAPGALERHDIPITDWFDARDADPAARDFLQSWIGLMTGRPPETVSLGSVLDYDPVRGSVYLHYHSLRHVFAGGTRSLVEALANDVAGPVEPGRPVTEIRQDDEGVTVVVSDGEELRASICVLAVPIAVMGSIAFDPPLDERRTQALAHPLAARCVKVWAEARGLERRSLATGWGEPPLYWTACERELAGAWVLVVGFGLEDSLDVRDVAAVQDALRHYHPDVEVRASGGYDWNADPYSRGAWAVRAPGALLRGDVDAIRAPHGRVVPAGSDVAHEFPGWIAGAVESGRDVAADVLARLGQPAAAPRA